jgi:N utilization substance protein B
LSRRKGRVLAFQALYSHDVGGVSVEELLKLEWAGKDDESESAESVDMSRETTFTFARLLISGTIEHLDEIDALIKKHLSGKWEFDRVNKVSLSILEISVFSLLYQKDTAPTIVIDEAIDIAKEYGADDAFKFINAVLDSIRKEIVKD